MSTLWKDVLLVFFAFLLEVMLISFLSLGSPVFYYVNVLVPVGMAFLCKGDSFFLRLSLLLGVAFLLDIFSFSPFGFWLLRTSFLLGIAFFWVEAFSRGTVSLAIFFIAYPFLEFLLERFVVLPVSSSGNLVLFWALLGKLVNAFVNLFLFFLWLGWRDYDVG